MEVSDATWLRAGRILVVDRGAHTMYVFGADGSLRTALGRRGPGPGEFSRLGVVTVTDEDSIFVHDPVRRTLQVFHPDTGLVRTISAAFPAGDGAVPIAVWRSGPERLLRLAYRPQPLSTLPASREWNRWTTTAVLALVNEAGELLAEPVEFDGPYSAKGASGDLRLPFSNSPFVFVGTRSVAFGSGQEFELTLADAGTLSRRLRVSWPSLRERIRPAEIDRLTTTLRGRARSPAARAVVGAQFSRELLPEFRPAVGGVLISADGLIWASRFEPPVAVPHEAIWYVLDARGAPLGRVHLPPNSHLTAVARDRVLLVQRDSMDVETVRLFRLVR